MIIAYDATSLYRKTTGIESYTANLLKYLLADTGSDRFLVLIRGTIPVWLEQFQNKVEFVQCMSRSQVYCEQVWIPQVLREKRPDLAHFPAFPPGLAVNIPHVMTVHDAGMWRHSDLVSFKNRMYMKPLTELALKRTVRIITVSESSRFDIASYTSTPLEKIVNTYEAIADDFKVIEDKVGLRVRLQQSMVQKDPLWVLPEKYILSVGSIEPRKNLITLLRAFSLLKTQEKSSHKLVLIGRKAWGFAVLKKQIQELGLENDVILTGHLSVSDLVSFYNLADVFVFPSIYEGFGLPPLEAMACGTPVIASNVASLLEVSGSGALLVDPLDVRGWARAMGTLIKDYDFSQALILRSTDRVKDFSWSKTVVSTFQVYHGCVSLKKRCFSGNSRPKG